MDKTCMIGRLAIGGLALALAACGSGSEGTIEGEGGDLTYSIDNDGDAVTADFTGPDGETMAMRSGDEAADDLPAGFTAYPGSQIVTSTKIDTPDGGGVILVMNTQATPDEVVAFYRQQIEAAEGEIRGETKQGGMIFLNGSGPDGLEFGVGASPGPDGQTTIQLTVGRGN